jgi:hypothetical protein
MARGLKLVAAVLLCGQGIAWAADRLAVLEFFGRPEGAYCSAAGPAMISLQQQFEGQAVLLEYDYDHAPSGRLDRFWVARSSATYLPLVMVGSGYRTSSGNVDYENEYTQLIEDELARPPRGEVIAFWRRVGNRVRTYLSVHNSGSNPLAVDEDATVWVIVYEKAPIGVSNTWVRSAVEWPLESDLLPGETLNRVIDVAAPDVANWNHVASLVLVDDRPRSGEIHDAVQATETAAASLTVKPNELMVTPASPAADLVLSGPHVLQWTATTDVPWLEVEPASGTLPSTATALLRPALRDPAQTSATVSIEATGDSMAFEALIGVKVGARVRRPTGRRSPVE